MNLEVELYHLTTPKSKKATGIISPVASKDMYSSIRSSVGKWDKSYCFTIRLVTSGNPGDLIHSI